jgi:hypothetical protein
MTQVQLITQLISKLDTNQMALQAALEEVSLWIRQRGSEDVAGNINGGPRYADPERCDHRARHRRADRVIRD